VYTLLHVNLAGKYECSMHRPWEAGAIPTNKNQIRKSILNIKQQTQNYLLGFARSAEKQT